MKARELFLKFPKDVRVVCREKCKSTEGPFTLVYGDEAGKIRIGFFFGTSDYSTYDLNVVPDEIASQGTKAVQTFAKEAAHKLIELLQQHHELKEKRMHELHQPYELQVDGVTIKGFVRADARKEPRTSYMKLVMTEPFQVEAFLHVRPSCLGEAMGQRRTFDEDGNLSSQEVQRQTEALKELYESEIRKRNTPPAHPTLQALVRKH
ncbi:hypothetical protein KBA73_02115 [Patescibacteria group bacterium]|nr:hypothetical protein [Patescibacteria group bacterium]